jgi:AraC family transcriptional regulator
MEPRIETWKEKKLVGNRLSMSLVDFQVTQLWKTFMPRRKEVKNTLTKELISMSVYPPFYFDNFDPNHPFEKWAASEVTAFDHVPNGMETFLLPTGLYAIFHYKGLHSDPAIYQYIFNTWLPHSAYGLDDRPHVEILGEHYRNNDPESEEDICIPVKHKGY